MKKVAALILIALVVMAVSLSIAYAQTRSAHDLNNPIAVGFPHEVSGLVVTISKGGHTTFKTVTPGDSVWRLYERFGIRFEWCGTELFNKVAKNNMRCSADGFMFVNPEVADDPKHWLYLEPKHDYNAPWFLADSIREELIQMSIDTENAAKYLRGPDEAASTHVVQNDNKPSQPTTEWKWVPGLIVAAVVGFIVLGLMIILSGKRKSGLATTPEHDTLVDEKEFPDAEPIGSEPPSDDAPQMQVTEPSLEAAGVAEPPAPPLQPAEDAQENNPEPLTVTEDPEHAGPPMRPDDMPKEKDTPELIAGVFEERARDFNASPDGFYYAQQLDQDDDGDVSITGPVKVIGLFNPLGEVWVGELFGDGFTTHYGDGRELETRCTGQATYFRAYKALLENGLEEAVVLLALKECMNDIRISRVRYEFKNCYLTNVRPLMHDYQSRPGRKNGAIFQRGEFPLDLAVALAGRDTPYLGLKLKADGRTFTIAKISCFEYAQYADMDRCLYQLGYEFTAMVKMPDMPAVGVNFYMAGEDEPNMFCTELLDEQDLSFECVETTNPEMCLHNLFYDTASAPMAAAAGGR